uniref:Uncharacterized protein n=1 Tax=Tanacetum cinerariifolium TaxID=118510 RepID=A0A699JSK7_TANCI|nr:hypothetical protein [Tanacetum cinerariifolium]
MDNKKHIVNLESFKEMLHIRPRLPGQAFVEPPFEEEILAFLCFLRHGEAIRKLTDVEHKYTKKSNEMYYPRFTKVIIHHFMSKDPSILRRNKVNWHYVRDDHMFTMIKLVSRHQNTQQFSDLLPIELTNEDIRNSNAYKEYYVPAKASKAKSLSALSEMKELVLYQGFLMYPLIRLRKKSLRTWLMKKVMMMKERMEDEGNDEDDEEEGSDYEQASNEEEFIHPSLSTHAKEETRDEESFDPISITPEDTDDEGNGEENLGINVGREEGHIKEEEEDKLYLDVNINQGRELIRVITIYNKYAQSDTRCRNGLKEQVKVQVSKILPKIEQNVNEKLKAEVLTRSSNSSKTSYVVAADLSEMELKKILIEKMEGNKSIHRSNEQRNLYKALVEAYKSDKIILDTYRDTVTLKRRYDDNADKDEEPSAGSDRGSKRRREGKEPERQQASLLEQRSQYRIPLRWKSPHIQSLKQTLSATHESIQPWISKLAKQSDSRSSFNELMDTLVDFSNFLMNRIKVDTLTPELLVGPTYELMKGSCKSLVELKFLMEEVYKATTDQLDWVNPEGQQYLHNLLKPLPLIPNN